MNKSLYSGCKKRSQKACVDISAEQQDLKEQHACRPNRWCVAKLGLHAMANDWLDLKHEKGTQKRGDRKRNPIVGTDFFHEPGLGRSRNCDNVSIHG